MATIKRRPKKFKYSKKQSKKDDIYVKIFLIVIFLFLFVLVMFKLKYDSKELREEWEKHVNNGDIYLGNGEWINTHIIINNTKNTSEGENQNG